MPSGPIGTPLTLSPTPPNINYSTEPEKLGRTVKGPIEVRRFSTLQIGERTLRSSQQMLLERDSVGHSRETTARYAGHDPCTNGRVTFGVRLSRRSTFQAATTPARVLNEEEPYAYIRCGKPFDVKSTIECVAAKLGGAFRSSFSRLDAFKMREDWRIVAVTEIGFDRYAAPARPGPRTIDDYLRER